VQLHVDRQTVIRSGICLEYLEMFSISETLQINISLCAEVMYCWHCYWGL